MRIDTAAQPLQTCANPDNVLSIRTSLSPVSWVIHYIIIAIHHDCDGGRLRSDHERREATGGQRLKLPGETAWTLTVRLDLQLPAAFGSPIRPRPLVHGVLLTYALDTVHDHFPPYLDLSSFHGLAKQSISGVPTSLCTASRP